MAIYVDTTQVTDGDGTEPTPFNTLTSVAWIEGAEVLIKRGSNENLNSSEFIGTDFALTTIGSYGDPSDPLPVISSYKNDLTSGWVEISPNVWMYTFADTGFNPPTLLGTNTIENAGERKQFVALQATGGQKQFDIAVSGITVGATTQIQVFGHGLIEGQYVYISEVTGTGAEINGYFQISYINVNLFTIDVDTTGDGPYSNGRTLGMNHENIPSVDSEWDYWQGVAGHSSALILYAEEDPATFYSNIYYGRWFDTPFTFFRNTGLVEISDVEIAYCTRPINIGLGNSSVSTQGNLWVHDCVFHDNYIGLDITSAVNATQFWLDGMIIEDNVLYNNRSGGIIGLDYVRNSHVRRNVVYNCCQSLSNGGIYYGNSFAPVGEENRIYNNEVYRIIAGNYWPVDGAGIMVDSDSDNCLIYANYVYNTEVAYNDNSSSNTIWYGNLAIDCDFGMKVSDSEGKMNMDVKIWNNTYIRCGSDRIKQSEIISKDRVIRINGASGDATAVVDVANNIIFGYDPLTAVGLSVEQQFILAGATYTESGNCFHNLERKLQENGVDVSGTIDATDISVNPLIGSMGVPSGDSPCYRSGVFKSFNLTDNNGSRFSVPPTMGAYEFASGSPAATRGIRS